MDRAARRAGRASDRAPAAASRRPPPRPRAPHAAQRRARFRPRRVPHRGRPPAARARPSRIREPFEAPSHRVLELTRGRGQTRQQFPGRAALIGDGQEHKKDDLGVADAALERFQLARLKLELRLLEQALRLPQVLRDPAAHVVELALPARPWRSGAPRRARAARERRASAKRCCRRSLARTGQRTCSRMPYTTRPRATPTTRSRATVSSVTGPQPCRTTFQKASPTWYPPYDTRGLPKFTQAATAVPAAKTPQNPPRVSTCGQDVHQGEIPMRPPTAAPPNRRIPFCALAPTVDRDDDEAGDH